MATTSKNPVLYNIENLQRGRSTGVFSGVRSTQQLSDAALARTAEANAYSARLDSARIGTEDRKVVYDTTLSDLIGKTTAAKEVYDKDTTAFTEVFPDLQRKLANTSQRIIVGFNWNGTSFSPMYGTNPEWLKAQKAYDSAKDAQYKRTESYNSLVNTSKATAESAFETYAGKESRILKEFQAKQAERDPQGYLAYEAPAETDVSPTVTGETLADTELYSDTLASEMLGKKQQLQTQAQPEEDILSGVLQSSLYSR